MYMGGSGWTWFIRKKEVKIVLFCCITERMGEGNLLSRAAACWLYVFNWLFSSGSRLINMLWFLSRTFMNGDVVLLRNQCSHSTFQIGKRMLHQVTVSVIVCPFSFSGYRPA